MAVCLVCAEPLVDAVHACGQCGTACSDLDVMLRQAGKVSFLFGEAQAAAPEPVVEEEPLPKPKPKPKPSKSRSEVKAPKPPVQLPSTTVAEDLIRSRDAEVTRPVTLIRDHVRTRAAAYVLDVLICLVLNALIVKLILIVSPRTLDQILVFSLIPMVFVLLSFSFLYFWLFFSLFEKTLGSLILERWRTH